MSDDERPFPFPKDPVIEAYKRDIDVTLLLENLQRTPQERLDRMISILRLTQEMQRAIANTTSDPAPASSICSAAGFTTLISPN